uniref:Uncharacterized protein n=1 Tax=Anguilla anguilla TaxID=7936 RepID=A0A0E9Q2X8_ANGAN
MERERMFLILPQLISHNMNFHTKCRGSSSQSQHGGGEGGIRLIYAADSKNHTAELMTGCTTLQRGRDLHSGISSSTVLQQKHNH